MGKACCLHLTIKPMQMPLLDLEARSVLKYHHLLLPPIVGCSTWTNVEHPNIYENSTKLCHYCKKPTLLLFQVLQARHISCSIWLHFHSKVHALMPLTAIFGLLKPTAFSRNNTHIFRKTHLMNIAKCWGGKCPTFHSTLAFLIRFYSCPLKLPFSIGYWCQMRGLGWKNSERGPSSLCPPSHLYTR